MNETKIDPVESGAVIFEKGKEYRQVTFVLEGSLVSIDEVAF